MLMFQKKFESYDELIKYLTECNKLDKADFELVNGMYVLNLVRFDTPR